MKIYTRDEIVEQAKELAKMIANTEEVSFFKIAESKINENEKINLTISEIKSLQKQAVNLEHYGKKEALKSVENLIDEKQEYLDTLPLVQQFQGSQVEVNDLLQLVTNTISNTVTDEIILDTDGDLLKGETGSKVFANEKSGGSCPI